MKFLLKVPLGLFLLSLGNIAYAEQIRLEKSTLGEFSQVVSDYLDKPIIVATDLQKPFSINGSFKDKEELKELFKTSIIAAGLSYTESNLSIVVANASPKIEPLSSAPLPIHQDLIQSLPAVKLSVITYPLKHLSSSQILPVLHEAFVGVSIIESAANNALIISASDSTHKNIKKVIASLDYPVKQVLIEAVISELSDKDYQGLDAKLQNYANLNQVLADAKPYTLANPLSSLADFGMKLLTSKSLRFFLDWVKTSDTSSVLSKPKILTLDRKEASIIVGQNVPFITGKSTSSASSTSTPFQTIQRQDIGLKLQVTPVILPGGLVQLSIVQESSSISLDTTASDVITNKRAVTSTALLSDGETLLLGGLSSHGSSAGNTSTIPDGIPFLSWFFSGNTKNENNTNLVVLITAKIINPSAPPALSLQGAEQAAQIFATPDGFDVPVTRLK